MMNYEKIQISSGDASQGTKNRARKAGENSSAHSPADCTGSSRLAGTASTSSGRSGAGEGTLPSRSFRSSNAYSVDSVSRGTQAARKSKDQRDSGSHAKSRRGAFEAG